jgi:glycine cleavage system H protein
MPEIRFTKDHEYIRIDGDIGIVGISDHAQKQLGDIVFVELPEVGRKAGQGEEIAVVESVKAASEVYAPISGEVIEVNAALSEDPGKINAHAETDAWFLKLRIADRSELEKLMSPDDYTQFLETLS